MPISKTLIVFDICDKNPWQTYPDECSPKLRCIIWAPLSREKMSSESVKNDRKTSYQAVNVTVCISLKEPVGMFYAFSRLYFDTGPTFRDFFNQTPSKKLLRKMSHRVRLLLRGNSTIWIAFVYLSHHD